MIPFMKLKWVSVIISTIAIFATAFWAYEEFGGFNKGLDFAGGIVLELHENDIVNPQSVRDFLKTQNIEAVVQSAGKSDDKMVKIEIGSKQEQQLQSLANETAKELEENNYSINSVSYLRYHLVKDLAAGDADKIRVESSSQVGPTIGDYLQESATRALTVSLVLIMIYVTFRFKLNFAVGALAALMHDLVLVMTLIAVLQIPLSVPVIAALLTILGYSINDTIVVFDRIRENMEHHENIGMEHLIDRSISSSISRTIITSVTTLIAVSSVYFLGGDTLSDMALVLILGIIVGTYSSIFIASPVVVFWDRFFSKGNRPA